MTAATVIDERREFTVLRLQEFKGALTDNAEKVTENTACVYVTGSGGRGEMSSHSDLDVFIVSDIVVSDIESSSEDAAQAAKPKLSNLDAILLKAELIRAIRTPGLKFPDFSKDGKFLEGHTVHDLCLNLGKPEDDHANTFTARLLLLLESKPILGVDTYRRVIDKVIDSYWRDYDEHQSDFRPVFLINDIIRMWKTLCINYEAFTEKKPDEKRAKRKLSNYKLKHSRALTCYSAVVYLMQVFSEQHTVSRTDVQALTGLSPTERLQWVTGRPCFAHGDAISRLLEVYGEFLRKTDHSEAELIKIFMDQARTKELVGDDSRMANTIVELLQKMGAENELYRYLIV